MRDFKNPPRKLSPSGVYGIDYEAWGKGEPPLQVRPSQVKDIRDIRNPLEMGDLSAFYRADMQALALANKETYPFHEWLDLNLQA